MSRSVSAVGLLALFPMAFALVLAHCDDAPRSHVLLAQAYEPDRQCLNAASSVDLVEGPQPSAACDPVCLVAPAGQQGARRGVFVTTMCAPYPPLDDVSGMLAGCTEALAAFTRGDTCSPDGTSTSPATDDGGSEGGDAGDEAGDAAGEAAGDAAPE